MEFIEPAGSHLSNRPPQGGNDSATTGLNSLYVSMYFLPGSSIRRALSVVVAAAGVMVGLAACASSARPAVATDAASPGTMTIRADWNDVDAAVEIAITRAEMAILRRTAEPADQPEQIRFELLTMMDERGVLTVTRDAGAGDAMIPIHLEARVGHFGDPAREQVLLRAMADRLEQLAGVDYAPLR